MLRSWTERIRIYLHPQQVVLVRQSGLFQRRVSATRLLPAGEDAHGEHQHPWSSALVALETALAQPQWQQARATVILSGEFVRYRLAPWDGRLTAEEQAALLRHRFEEVYGDAMHHWQLSVADAGYGKQSLVCAFDPRLLAALQDAFSRANSGATARLVSVQPLLMTAFNRWRRQIDGHGAWFVLAEQTHLTIALLQDGEWRGIRSKACAPGWEQTLPLLLQREALQLGVEAGTFPVYFYRPGQPSFKPDLPQPVHVLRLPGDAGFAPDGDKNIAAALC